VNSRIARAKDLPMSLDQSLKTAGNLASHRNVLKRHERIERLKDTKDFDPKEKQVLHLQKTGNRKVR
jgi:small basic protein (TIGR04137 family)